MDINNIKTVMDLVDKSIKENDSFIQTITGREDDTAMIGYAEYGIPWYEGSCQDKDGLEDIAGYRKQVTDTHCSAWMDNTTIVTAKSLMSTLGPEVITPLTVWDLATFIRSVICYEHIYHHEHPEIDNGKINNLLGANVFIGIPLPFRTTTGNRLLPDPWNGAHKYFCDVWSNSYAWLKRLHNSIGTNTLDDQQLHLVTEAWKNALGVSDLNPAELVNYKEVDRRWQSPSNQMLVDTVNVTGMDDTYIYLDPREEFQELFKLKRQRGIRDESEEAKYNILSDLNLRSYVNQCFAEFFRLPYASSIGRLPFRRHLYDLSLQIQQELATAKVIDYRYAELGKSVKLKLPVFLALALQKIDKPDDLWTAIKELRIKSSAFRLCREEMDKALIRGDLKETEKIGKALNTSVEDLLKLAGKATTSASAAVFEDIAKGDISGVGTGISAAVAVAKGILKSSFVDRLMWRLRRPQLLWINDIIDESKCLTESLPDFSRVWQVPPNRQAIFGERFRMMDKLLV